MGGIRLIPLRLNDGPDGQHQQKPAIEIEAETLSDK
jgi:hypothetical protein